VAGGPLGEYTWVSEGRSILRPYDAPPKMIFAPRLIG
jgi:hypothetical protein